MAGIKFYLLDTETTGLKSGHHEVTEIGIIREHDRVQIHRCIKCDYPERASFDALMITKKTMSDLEKGYDKVKVIEECNKFFAEDGGTPASRCIVAHNAPFDRRFVHAMWEAAGYEFPADLWIDTITLMKDFLKVEGLGKVSVALHNACDLLQIKKLSDAHNAKVDSRNEYLIFKELRRRNIDYLPHIKTFIHSIKKNDPNEYDFDPVEDIDA